MNGKKLPTLIAIVVLLAVLGAGVWYWQNKKTSETAQGGPGAQIPLTDETASVGFGANVLEKAQNPLKEKIPETNPFQTETNPLKDVYQNPF